VRKHDTKFKPGQSGNPKGRPIGSRNKLSEHFITDLAELWDEQGSDILKRVADEHPEKLLAAMVQVLPKDFQVSVMDESSVKWVINAQPPLTTLEWQKMHGLPIIEDSEPAMLESDQ
jgi:hypothetical protein